MSTPPILVDQIIEARWIIPVEPDDTTLEHHSLVIQGERILDLLPTEQARQRYTARETTVL
ncbi:MAG: TRZ/ATZ family hydrolase, partial [Zoogloea sp.]